MRRLLIFTMNYWPEPTAIGPMATDLAEHLAGKDWEVTVLTGFPMAPQWSVYDGYRGRIFQREKRNKVTILRVWVYVPAPPGRGRMRTWKRVAFDTTLAVSGLPVALALPRQDAIIAVCPPLQAGLASLPLKRLWGAPILYWLQDIVPDAALSSGMMREGAAVRFGRRLEQRVYRGVDRIAIIARGFQQNLVSKDVPPEKMIFLPNWADVARFDAGPDGKQARASLGLSDLDFVVVHAGNMGAKQCMENVVRAMKQLEARGDIHLLLVGDGNCIETVKAEAARLRVARLRFLPTTTGVEFVGLLRAADLLLINQARNVKDALIPSKLLTYLPSGRPVLAAVHPESEAAQFIRCSGSGISVEPEMPEKLAGGILNLRGQPELRREMGRAGADFIRREYDRPIILQRFENALLELVRRALNPAK